MIEEENIIAAAAAAALDETGKEKKQKKLYPRIKSKNRYMCLNKAGQEDSLKPTRISFFQSSSSDRYMGRSRGQNWNFDSLPEMCTRVTSHKLSLTGFLGY